MPLFKEACLIFNSETFCLIIIMPLVIIFLVHFVLILMRLQVVLSDRMQILIQEIFKRLIIISVFCGKTYLIQVNQIHIFSLWHLIINFPFNTSPF